MIRCFCMVNAKCVHAAQRWAFNYEEERLVSERNDTHERSVSSILPV